MIFLLLVATSQVKAQSVDVVIRENGTERKESIDLPKSMTYPLDSLLNDWKAKNYIDLGKDCSTAEINPLFSDSVYIDRLSRIPAVRTFAQPGFFHVKRLQLLYADFRGSIRCIRTSIGAEIPSDYRIRVESFSRIACRSFRFVAIHDRYGKDLRTGVE